MKRHHINLFVFVSIFFATTQVCFAIQSPVSQLQGIANRMIRSLESNKSRLSNFNVIRRIVNRILLPHVDLNRMSASVVGRKWRSASGAQRATFKKEFAYLVTTTYASALSSYDRDKVRFYPLRQSYQGRSTVRVKSVIVRANGQRIPVSYNVVRAGGGWKVYDFSIENVSIVRSYRSQFAGVLSNRGMRGLIARLKRHNKKR